MPVIQTHVPLPIAPDQREALKAAYGRAVALIPGKSEDWLMCLFPAPEATFFGGSDAPAAYVDVHLMGEATPATALEAFGAEVTAAVSSTLSIPRDRIYVRSVTSPDWGWNGAMA